MTALHLVATAVLAVTTDLARPRETTRPLIPVDARPPAQGMVFFGGAFVPGPYVFERREDGDALLVTLRDRVITRLRRTPAVGDPRSPAEMNELCERTIEAYQKILTRGGAIVLLTGVQVTVPAVRMKDHLIPTLRALDDPALDSIARRKALFGIWNDESIVQELMNTYRRDEALWERIRLIESGR